MIEVGLSATVTVAGGSTVWVRVAVPDARAVGRGDGRGSDGGGAGDRRGVGAVAGVRLAAELVARVAGAPADAFAGQGIPCGILRRSRSRWWWTVPFATIEVGLSDTVTVAAGPSLGQSRSVHKVWGFTAIGRGDRYGVAGGSGARDRRGVGAVHIVRRGAHGVAVGSRERDNVSARRVAGHGRGGGGRGTVGHDAGRGQRYRDRRSRPGCLGGSGQQPQAHRPCQQTEPQTFTSRHRYHVASQSRFETELTS